MVALESTILAHGMPYPDSTELAAELSSILRAKAAVPATVAVDPDGVCRIGLSVDEIDDLCRAGEDGRATKVSSRDLPVLLGGQNQRSRRRPGDWGATTVASTMRLAHLAGIDVFVTGGTGGVHREGQITMDVSADLYELARTPVLVVSAGIKSVLDIPRTLEKLESLGVPAAAYGTNDFPAFFSPASGIAAPLRVDDASHAAASYLASRDLGLPGGMLVAVPNGDPAGEVVEHAIQQALAEVGGGGGGGMARARAGTWTGGTSPPSS